MKRMKTISDCSRVCLIFLAALFGFYCWVPAYSDEVNQDNASRSNRSSGLTTIVPKPAESIIVDGVEYDLRGAIRTLLEVLSSDDDRRKVRFLGELKKFGQRLQGDLIPRLETELQRQPSPEVRGGILELVMHSKDPKFIELCRLAKEDRDARVRAFAGTMLIDNGRIEGFEALTSGLPGLNKDERRSILPILIQGIDRMQIPFVDSKGTLRPRPQTKEEVVVFLDEWSAWWKRNGDDVIKKAKESIQPTAK